MAAERQPPQSQGCHHDLADLATSRQQTGGSRGSSSGSHSPLMLRSCFFFFYLSPSDAEQAISQLSLSLSLSADRHQRRRIMCNYNRQSKTKPFTFNEILLEKGRLPQGGILMKQMAECSQGPTLTVLFFTVRQHFPAFWRASPVSWPLFVCTTERMCVCVCAKAFYWHISQDGRGGGVVKINKWKK